MTVANHELQSDSLHDEWYHKLLNRRDMSVNAENGSTRFCGTPQLRILLGPSHAVYDGKGAVV